MVANIDPSIHYGYQTQYMLGAYTQINVSQMPNYSSNQLGNIPALNQWDPKWTDDISRNYARPRLSPQSPTSSTPTPPLISPCSSVNEYPYGGNVAAVTYHQQTRNNVPSPPCEGELTTKIRSSRNRTSPLNGAHCHVDYSGRIAQKYKPYNVSSASPVNEHHNGFPYVASVNVPMNCQQQLMQEVSFQRRGNSGLPCTVTYSAQQSQLLNLRQGYNFNCPNPNYNDTLPQVPNTQQDINNMTLQAPIAKQIINHAKPQAPITQHTISHTMPQAPITQPTQGNEYGNQMNNCDTSNHSQILHKNCSQGANSSHPEGGWIHINKTKIPYVYRKPDSTFLLPFVIVTEAAKLDINVSPKLTNPTARESTVLTQLVQNDGINVAFHQGSRLVDLLDVIECSTSSVYYVSEPSNPNHWKVSEFHLQTPGIDLESNNEHLHQNTSDHQFRYDQDTADQPSKLHRCTVDQQPMKQLKHPPPTNHHQPKDKPEQNSHKTNCKLKEKPNQKSKKYRLTESYQNCSNTQIPTSQCDKRGESSTGSVTNNAQDWNILSSRKVTTSKGKPITFQMRNYKGKEISCFIREEDTGSTYYVLLEAIYAVYFKAMSSGLSNLSELIKSRLARKDIKFVKQEEEECCIQYYCIPSKSLQCRRIISFEAFKRVLNVL